VSPIDIIASGNAKVFAGLFFLLLISLGVRYLLSKLSPHAPDAPLIPQDVILRPQPILTEAEARFFRTLELAVGGQYLICPQLSIWTFVAARSAQGGGAGAFTNRINLKRVDFVLVDRHSFSPIVVIELDDLSHQHERGQRRDAFVEAVMERAGLPLVQIPASHTYDVNAIRKRLALAKTA
jgi:hypothetical protein